MFDFRLFNTTDGNQIIDKTLKTPYDSLTPLQMLEYMEVDAQLSLMDRLERKKKSEEQKFAKNLLRKVACFCGIIYCSRI